jgi:hypothetical protein
MSDWQPIETFPRDGECYLATDNRVDGGFPQVVFLDEDTGRLSVPDARIGYSPAFFTHWMPLPEPPK